MNKMSIIHMHVRTLQKERVAMTNFAWSSQLHSLLRNGKNVPAHELNIERPLISTVPN